MSEGHTESAQDIIQADDLVKDLTKTTEPVFTLRDKNISGTLDLRYRTIYTAVDIQGCPFLGDVDLRWCNFEQTVDFKRCTFQQAFNKIGQTASQTIHCKKDFTCAEAIFKGPVSLNSARIEGVADFKKARFERSQGVDFIAFTSTGQLICNEATFTGPADFNALKCEGGGFFDGAIFEGEADFVFTKFGGSLFFSDSSFSRRLILEAVEVSRELDLTAQQFQEVLLYNATTEVLGLAYDVESADYTAHYTFPRTQASLDLRGFTFKRLRGSKAEALQFAKAQKPTVFSLDPYVQLEEHYEKIGKDTEARDVHYEGRRAMRGNADTNSDVTWTFGRKASDAFLRALTGYGVRTTRVAWAIAIFLVVGTIVFSLGDFTPWGEALSVKPSETSALSGTAQNPAASEPTVVDQVSYSVDRFIPVNLGVDDRFEPRQSWSQVYDLIHVVAGWLLIPLFLASWSGLVRSQR